MYFRQSTKYNKNVKKYQFSFQKKFGQNFLIDTMSYDKIISSAEITKDDFVFGNQARKSEQ